MVFRSAVSPSARFPAPAPRRALAARAPRAHIAGQMRLYPIPAALALILPAAAAPAEPAGADAQAGFERLWTAWGGANSEAMAVESEAMRRLRVEVAAADAARLRQLRSQGRELGERVGEVVRLGDCAEGERIAREAGDFALVEAVRGHCAAGDQEHQPSS